MLIGAALVLFYALLLSVSEHIVFPAAYMISATATTLLLSFYTLSIVRKKKVFLLFTSFFSVFYGFLYILLQSEDYALLLGSTGLFVLLA
ncbi:MAG: cell envelope integrity protein CreD, partial [Fibrobacter sp.]|nr:cell envelope integrity protein CreD [Fibrobacter sp.]